MKTISVKDLQPQGIEDVLSHQRRLLAAVKRLEKQGTSDKLFASVEPNHQGFLDEHGAAVGHPLSGRSYGEMATAVGVAIGEYALQLEQTTAKLKAALDYLDGVYVDMKGKCSGRSKQYNPNAVAFIKDYEASNPDKIKALRRKRREQKKLEEIGGKKSIDK